MIQAINMEVWFHKKLSIKYCFCLLHFNLPGVAQVATEKRLFCGPYVPKYGQFSILSYAFI